MRACFGVPAGTPSGPCSLGVPEGGFRANHRPKISHGLNPRSLPERGARPLPAPPADLVVRPRGPLSVWVSLDVGVKPEPAPQWLPIHGRKLRRADPAEKG